MLAIRMQRTGRRGHAQFRVIIQESRRSPKSGSIVQLLGSYDPHTKQANIDKEKATFYLANGAQPSDRVALLLQKEGVKLPAWVKVDTKKQASVRNADKRRSTRPAEPEAADETASDVPAAEETAPETETTEAPEASEAAGTSSQEDPAESEA